MQADRAEHVRVLAYVVAPHGAARRGDVPVFEPYARAPSRAPRGSRAPSRRIWTLPPGPAGEDRLAVRLPGSVASRVVLRVEALTGPAAMVAVGFDRDALAAGAVEGVKVVARVLDAGGNPVAAPLELAADGGALEGVAEPGPAR